MTRLTGPEDAGLLAVDIDDDLKPLGVGKALLGECPTWWPGSGQVRWVDIRSKEIWSVSLAERRVRKWTVPGLAVGISPTDRDRMLLALTAQISILDEETGHLIPLATAPDPRTEMRFNELKCDPRGRVWVGHMNDVTRTPTEGRLFRVDGPAFTALVGNVAIPNSLAWSPDGSVMYFADGRDPVIWSFDFDADTGTVANRRIFATLPTGRGIPDGAAVDAEGFLWSANYGGWAITRYTPAGAVDRVIEMPVSQPTSCTFAGDDLDVLIATSAYQRLSDEQLGREPLAGEVFAMRVPVTGLAPVPAAEGPFADSLSPLRGE